MFDLNKDTVRIKYNPENHNLEAYTPSGEKIPAVKSITVFSQVGCLLKAKIVFMANACIDDEVEAYICKEKNG